MVAPVLTAGCMLSIYSSLGCEFIELDVGFTPSNQAWNQSTVGMGLFLVNVGDMPLESSILTSLHSNCDWYPSLFEDRFIDNDRTWKVSRIMAFIAGGSSLAAAILAWLFCITPLPASYLWPGMLLPLVMFAFIAEGSKFLLFDIGLCRNALWYPSGVDSLPQSAADCTLGPTAYFVISAGVVLLLSLFLVCLQSPHARELDPYYGAQQLETEKDEVKPSYTAREPEGLEEADYLESKPSYDHEKVSEDTDESSNNDNNTIERISESRLSTVEQLKLKQTEPDEERLEKFVQEMDLQCM